MWLKALLQWLGQPDQIAEEHRGDEDWAEEQRSRHERRKAELRRDQITPWCLPPL
jgi:hypothetical protein